MDIEFDVAKSRKNEEDRGLPFAEVANFNWTSALVVQDVREEYPEPRFLALGLIGDRLHAVVFSPTKTGIRVISFRKSNKREVKSYGQAKAQS